jgi:hypothetical protein
MSYMIRGSDNFYFVQNTPKSIFSTSLAIIYLSLCALRLSHIVEPPLVRLQKQTTDDKSKSEELQDHAKRLIKVKLRHANLCYNNRTILLFVTGVASLLVAVVPGSWKLNALFGFAASFSTFAVIIEEWGRLRQGGSQSMDIKL